MKINLLHLIHYPIYDQLLLEEALLRNSMDNWLILNEGSCPSIVMGISGKTESLVNTAVAKRLNLPLIKRYSGGGTVVVDPNTIFFSFIGNKKDTDIPLFPKPLMQWIEKIIASAFYPLPFVLQENDFALDMRKIGGNAQYLKKDRFVHHTTFLWDYNPAYMEALKIPDKMPAYRKKRSHIEFITKLSDHLPCKKTFLRSFINSFAKPFSLEQIDIKQATPYQDIAHRTSTVIIEY